MNLRRTLERKPNLDIDKRQILDFVGTMYKKQVTDRKPVWNGRQIRNAVQTATALAEFESQGKTPSEDCLRPRLTVEHLKIVFNVLSQFDAYLEDLYGANTMQLAKSEGLRADEHNSQGNNSSLLTARQTRSNMFQPQPGSPSMSYQKGFPVTTQLRDAHPQATATQPLQVPMGYSVPIRQVQAGYPLTQFQEANIGFVPGQPMLGSGNQPWTAQQGQVSQPVMMMQPPEQVQQPGYPSTESARQGTVLNYGQQPLLSTNVQQAPTSNASG